MTINKIEVSLFPSESALSKYPIRRPTIILEKRLILVWRVIYIYIYVYIYIYIYIYLYIYMCVCAACVCANMY